MQISTLPQCSTCCTIPPSTCLEVNCIQFDSECLDKRLIPCFISARIIFYLLFIAFNYFYFLSFSFIFLSLSLSVSYLYLYKTILSQLQYYHISAATLSFLSSCNVASARVDSVARDPAGAGKCSKGRRTKLFFLFSDKKGEGLSQSKKSLSEFFDQRGGGVSPNSKGF